MSLLDQIRRFFFPAMSMRQVAPTPVAAVLVVPDEQGNLKPLTVSGGQFVIWQAPAPLPGYTVPAASVLVLGEQGQADGVATSRTTTQIDIPAGTTAIQITAQGQVL